MLTKGLLEGNKYLENYTNKENPSLSHFSQKLFTLSSLNETNNKLNLNDFKTAIFVNEFFGVLIDNMKEWQLIFNKGLSPHNF